MSRDCFAPCKPVKGGERGFFSCTHDVKGKAKGRRGAFPSLRPSPFSLPISLHERPTSELAEVCLSVDGEGSEEEWEDVVVSFLFLRYSSCAQKAFFYLFHRCPSTYPPPFSHFPPFSASFCLLHFSSSLFFSLSSLTLHGDNEATSLTLPPLSVEAVALSPLMPKGEKGRRLFFSRTPPLLTPFGTERGSFGGERGWWWWC